MIHKKIVIPENYYPTIDNIKDYKFNDIDQIVDSLANYYQKFQ